MLSRLITAIITCTLLATMPLSAKEKVSESTKKMIATLPIVNVKTLTEEMVQAFMEGEAENVILEISKGTLIPLNLVLSGNLVEILPREREPITFSIQQTFYLAITDYDVYLSKDLTHWSMASSFFSGDVSFRIDPTPQGPALTLGGEVNLKEEAKKKVFATD